MLPKVLSGTYILIVSSIWNSNLGLCTLFLAIQIPLVILSRSFITTNNSDRLLPENVLASLPQTLFFISASLAQSALFLFFCPFFILCSYLTTSYRLSPSRWLWKPLGSIKLYFISLTLYDLSFIMYIYIHNRCIYIYKTYIYVLQIENNNTARICSRLLVG